VGSDRGGSAFPLTVESVLSSPIDEDFRPNPANNRVLSGYWTNLLQRDAQLSQIEAQPMGFLHHDEENCNDRSRAGSHGYQ
jgi:hypothetical protein